MSRSLLLSSSLLFVVVVTGCGRSEPKAPSSRQESVPANSASESGHQTGGAQPAVASHDPTVPYTVPITSGDGSTKADDAKAGPGAKPKTGNASKQECSQLFDKYIELAIGSDARLEGIPPELIDQAKADARRQKGDPCEREVISRAKYNCAMAAKSTADWQKCMK